MRKLEWRVVTLVLCILAALGTMGYFLAKNHNTASPKKTQPQKTVYELISEKNNDVANKITAGAYTYKPEDFNIILTYANNLMRVDKFKESFTTLDVIPDTESVEHLASKYDTCLAIAEVAKDQPKYTACRSDFLAVAMKRKTEVNASAIAQDFAARHSEVIPVRQPVNDENQL